MLGSGADDLILQFIGNQRMQLFEIHFLSVGTHIDDCYVFGIVAVKSK